MSGLAVLPLAIAGFLLASLGWKQSFRKTKFKAKTKKL